MKILQNESTSLLIRVLVTPNAKEVRVTKVSENNYEVRVDERAIEGMANKRLIEIIADHFKVPKSKIHIVKGSKSRDKLVILQSPRLVQEE